jgi:hypothetical protein
MSHQISCYDGVLTVRLDGRANAQEVYQDVRSNLDNQSTPVIAILDLTLATNFDQPLKSMFYRACQHHQVAHVGICGVNPEVSKDVNDLLPVLRRVCRVVVSETEADLRADLGLAAPLPHQPKLSGMLAYLKSSDHLQDRRL